MSGAKPIKRELESDNDESIIKKQKMFDANPKGIKHWIVDKANWDLTEKQVLTLFKTVRIAVIDSEVDKNNNVIPHYHILGEAKVTPRQMRDWSLNSIRAAGIYGGLEAKEFFQTARPKSIQDKKHYENTIAYLKRKNSTFYEDETVVYGPALDPLWDQLQHRKEPQKFDEANMNEFRRLYPVSDCWKKIAAQQRFSKYEVERLQQYETQRKYEDSIRELNFEEKHDLMPNLPILEHAQNMRHQLVSHDQNSGVCMILCGGALMCKSTINRIIAHSFGEYAIWPGSQWIQKDALKFDTAARQGISTIVVEEMQWIDIQHRITLEKTLNSIKEQLTGAGLDVRLAKTKSSMQDDIKFKMDYLLISMNETEYVNYKILADKINSRPEFKRRFILINMDDPKYSDIGVCRTRKDNNWIGNEVSETKLRRFF